MDEQQSWKTWEELGGDERDWDCGKDDTPQDGCCCPKCCSYCRQDWLESMNGGEHTDA